jgi:hypothetical protein
MQSYDHVLLVTVGALGASVVFLIAFIGFLIALLVTAARKEEELRAQVEVLRTMVGRSSKVKEDV